MSEVLGSVWAGQVESVRLDVLACRVTVSIVVVDGSRPAGSEVSSHQAVFHGVSAVRWSDSVEGPWLRVEAAEIYAERLGGRHRVSLWLNDEGNRLVVDAEEVTLDGTAVLPRHSATPAAPAAGPSEPERLPGVLTGLWGGRFEGLHVDLLSKRVSLSLLSDAEDEDPQADLVPHLVILQEVSSLRLLLGDGAPRGEAWVREIRGAHTEKGDRFDVVFDSDAHRLEVHSGSAVVDFEAVAL